MSTSPAPDRTAPALAGRVVLVTADEVAAPAVYLMTDDARSITGSRFAVDGGRTVV